MGGVDRRGRTAPASRGGHAQVQLLQVAHADRPGGEGRRADGTRARPGLGHPPVPQGRATGTRGRGGQPARGARAVPIGAARDDCGTALLGRHVRKGGQLFREARRPTARDGLLPQGAGVRACRRPVAPLLPGARRGRARAAVGRLPCRVQEPGRGHQPLHRGGRLRQGDRGGYLVPPVAQGEPNRRDAQPAGGQALHDQDRQALRDLAQLRRG